MILSMSVSGKYIESVYITENIMVGVTDPNLYKTVNPLCGENAVLARVHTSW